MIRFNQPRYILPLIILPFIYIFYFLFHADSMGSPSNAVVLEEAEGLNPTIPAPILDRVTQKDKFEAYLIAHKNKRDFSAMQEIDNRSEKELIEQDSITKKTPPNHETTPSAFRTKRRGSYPMDANELNPPLITPAGENPVNPSNDDYGSQMDLFKAQMLFMDSLFYGRTFSI